MKRCFLGANSGGGFCSLYGEFPPKDAFLHVIKGGPGTGKSTLLKALASAAEEQGLEVCRVLCSGDPDSLDGVYIPKLALAWVDGTAPHVVEPALFGVTGDYWNLSEYFVLPFSPEEKEELLSLQKQYREYYREAYEHLRTCVQLGGAKAEELPEEPFTRALEGLPRLDRSGTLVRRFLSAVSCRGVLRLEEDLQDLRVLPASPSALPEAAREARRKGWDAILCLSPLDPSRAEALILPEAGLAAVTSPRPEPESIPCLSRATELLARAKALHDEMEALYRPHMDFDALSAFTARRVGELFS